jgi:PAS domain S-box-containing protein
VGCSEQEILGKKDDQLFELKQALMCQEQDQEVMAKNQVYSGEEYLTYNNGERHFIDMKKVPLLDKQGQVQGLIGVGRDITEHHRLEKRLKIADTVFENSKENFIVTDKRGNIISANKATCVLLGYSKSELLDANIKEFTSHQYENIEAALQENIPWQGEIICTKKSGEFILPG